MPKVSNHASSVAIIPFQLKQHILFDSTPTVRNYRQLIGKFDKFDSPEKNQGIGLTC
jgi:hypothetical protein